MLKTESKIQIVSTYKKEEKSLVGKFGVVVQVNANDTVLVSVIGRFLPMFFKVDNLQEVL